MKQSRNKSVQRIVMILLFAVWTVPGFCQVHDNVKMNQITIAEIGVGTLDGPGKLYYEILHPSYSKFAKLGLNSKLFNRGLMRDKFRSEDKHAAKLDTAMAERRDVELKTIIDRQGEVDLICGEEKDQIASELQELEKLVNQLVLLPITGEGPDKKAEKQGKQLIDMYNFSVKMTKDAYLPMATRKAEFLSILKDIKKSNAEYRLAVRCRKAVLENRIKNYAEIKEVSTKDIVDKSLTRWKEKWSNKSSSISNN